jgi:multiple sugar transport system substrate-binding protein
MRLSSKQKIIPWALAASLALAACSGDTTAAPLDEADGDSATGDITLTVWSWDATVEQSVAGFEAANPGIKVEVANVGSSMDEYTSLDNAIQAGSGVPDLVMFEYFAIPYFAIPGKLTDLTEFGAQDLENDYVASAWSNVTMGTDAVYALPSDYGPAVLFWNADTFAKAGLTEAPATWDEYYEAAKAIRALGGDYYIDHDTGDLFGLLAMIWQAGGRPFKVDGNDITIDFSEPETVKVLEFRQKMLDEGLLGDSVTAWSDDWNRALNDGTLATQNMGGWLTSSLIERAPDQSGNWRIALLPQWEAGEKVGAENGGSSFGIPTDAAHKEEAYKFLEYFTNGDGLQPRVDAGAFVPNLSVLDSPEFQDASNAFFGDEKTGAVLAEASEIAATGWQYPPFFEWARTVYADICAPLYTDHEGTLEGVFETWRERMVEYGNEQGFTVK